MVDANGHLDVKKLQREMAASIDEDKRYYRTDEMKKDKISKCASYDEFRQFVACAQDGLAPVGSKELQSLGNPTLGWKSQTALAGGKVRGARGGAKGKAGGKIAASRRVPHWGVKVCDLQRGFLYALYLV